MGMIVASPARIGWEEGRMPHVTSTSRSIVAGRDRGARDAGIGLPTPFAESVLDLVEQIPPGRVMSYGDIATVLGSGGARAVGTVMARFGSGVPWHRVIRSDGAPPAGHEVEALRRHRREGTPLAASGTRIDMPAARWSPGS
jgi:alkylated DNA nucleotide flippase Atl1